VKKPHGEDVALRNLDEERLKRSHARARVRAKQKLRGESFGGGARWGKR
jgi:hypothetical protein